MLSTALWNFDYAHKRSNRWGRSRLTRPRYDDTKVVQALDGMLGGLAFLVSYDLKLFQALGHGHQTAAQLAAALHIGERPAEALLGVAAAQGFVQCSNDV